MNLEEKIEIEENKKEIEEIEEIEEISDNFLFELNLINEENNENNLKIIKKLNKLKKNENKLKERKLKLEIKRKDKKEKRKENFNKLNDNEKISLKEKEKEENERKERNLRTSYSSNINICIDLNFQNENSERELRSLAVQIRLSYIELKLSNNPLALHLSSLTDGVVKEILTSQGYQNWFIRSYEQPVEEVFSYTNLIYLSPDAEEPLTILEPGKVYVIGGIVDRNIKQSLTLDKANQFEVPSYRLPIKEYFPSCQKTIINIDQVVRALCIFNSTQNWETAIRESVPQRRKGE